MKLDNIMIVVHAVSSLLVIDLARLINRSHRIISYSYTINHYSSKGNDVALYKELFHPSNSYKIKMSIGNKVKINNRVGIEKRPDITDEKTAFGHF
ncbi:hypothetical protein [Candidatus Enterovibrio escicola]|uniref:hypothetical protein n=1 Tax=Candidatus Enterovibrio escicola TaxID=1927127 RepID=UPI001237F615|nr:hypothetical protein [Candidatus Enterovibrio escacola]